MFSEARVGAFLNTFHVFFRFVAHGRANGCIDRDRQISSVTHSIGNATHMLTLLRLNAMCVQISNCAGNKIENIMILKLFFQTTDSISFAQLM